ncbi:peptide chain release factor N(5)-glutamine methyltransferase [Ramlibacter algicola]|uniref:Release factor glutamine methyltransferase n=1 Tax=Ramlibacter algicola TaxID=2795217 RepID=A0A934UQR3_9BURK|nr:peptide chain release factor N(5)-glutamine methyltransferase [Ramlibacter algicola]MBK0392081.1 peptide chain release factor N(5)-glutamine methyltransferase [Ramlibacter algicola]
MTLAQLLAQATALGLERLDAQLLLLQALGRDGSERAWLLAHDTDAVDADVRARCEAAWHRRLAGEPLAYIVGHKEFHGLDLAVDARVLVPRPDTETLVDWALEVMAGRPSPRVVDLGTGSGAIAVALKHRCAPAHVVAVDRSEEALAVAKANGDRLGLDVEWRRGDWLAGLAGPFDVIVSNPPYIADGDPHLPALRHEPRAALAAGPDGLDDLRHLASQAPALLAPGGWLLLEHGWDQADAVRGLLQAAGLVAVASRRDLAGIERCSGGQRPEVR